MRRSFGICRRRGCVMGLTSLCSTRGLQTKQGPRKGRHVDVQVGRGRPGPGRGRRAAPATRLGQDRRASAPSTSSPCSARRSSSRSSWGSTPTSRSCSRGICTILFLLICKNKVPSYLGTSASFVAGVAAIRAPGRRLRRRDRRDPGRRRRAAARRRARPLRRAPALIHKVLPPAVTGAVVMLIGFNLAPVVAGIYWPQDQWVALLTATFMVFAAVLLPGLLVADRGLPRADLRLPALVALRRASSARSHSVTGASLDGTGAVDHDRRRAGPASRPPTGSASRAATSPTASPSCTARASR